MKKFICSSEKYESKGEEKIAWHRIGEIFMGKNGKEYAKLYATPSQILSIFEDKPKPKQEPQFDEFGADNNTPESF